VVGSGIEMEADKFGTEDFSGDLVKRLDKLSVGQRRNALTFHFTKFSRDVESYLLNLLDSLNGDDPNDHGFERIELLGKQVWMYRLTEELMKDKSSLSRFFFYEVPSDPLRYYVRWVDSF